MIKKILFLILLGAAAANASQDTPVLRCILDDDGWFDLQIDLPNMTAAVAERQVTIVSFNEEEIILSGSEDGDTISLKLERASGNIEFSMISLGLDTYTQTGRCHGPMEF